MKLIFTSHSSGNPQVKREILSLQAELQPERPEDYVLIDYLKEHLDVNVDVPFLADRKRWLRLKGGAK